MSISRSKGTMNLLSPFPDLEKSGQLIKQGAEAKLYIVSYKGRDCILKERFAKTYRLPELDRTIRRRQTRAEARTLMRVAECKIRAPRLIGYDVKCGRTLMEYVHGVTLSECIQRAQAMGNGDGRRVLDELCAAMGQLIGQLHDAGIVHGDLTTSNVMVADVSDGCTHSPHTCSHGTSLTGHKRPRESKDTSTQAPKHNTDCTHTLFQRMYIIDFGLACKSAAVEDFGVDLGVMERAANASHPGSQGIVEKVLAAYESTRTDATHTKKTLKKLDEVRLRGRKRLAFG